MMTKIKKYSLIPYMLILFQMVCVAQSVDTEEMNPPKQKLSLAEERKFDYFFYEGLKLKNSGQLDASFEMFKHCLAIDATSSAALYELALLYIHFNQQEKAVSPMKKTIVYAPDNHGYHNILATLLFNLGMYGEAAEEYEILTKRNPEKPELYYYLAESYARMGEIGKAIDMYNEMENLLGMHEALSLGKFQLYQSLEQQDSAFNEIKKLADKYPAESRYPILLGEQYLQQNNHEEALKYFRKAIEIDPESPYYPVSMANYYEKAGQRDSAKIQIDAALVNQRLDIDTKLTILVRYIMQLQRSKQEDIDDSNVLFQTLLDQHPDDSRLKLIYGEYLAKQNKYDEARFQMRIVTESEPENREAWQQLLELSYQMRDFDEMIRICKKCREIFPEELNFHNSLGMAYYLKKDFTSAAEIYKDAIQATPDYNAPFLSYLYGQLGDTYFRMKETDNAFKAYEEALKYNDKNILVLNNYAYYLSLLKKDLSKAERMSALTIKMEPDNATYIDTYAWIFFIQGNLVLAKIYIEQAIAKDRTKSAVMIDHYGDILFLSGDKEKAVEQWEKARELGKKTATIDKKIAEKAYFEETEEELLNDTE